MNWLRRASSEPLWREEFSVRTADERYVTRRQLTKFLVLTSLGMFVGNHLDIDSFDFSTRLLSIRNKP